MTVIDTLEVGSNAFPLAYRRFPSGQNVAVDAKFLQPAHDYTVRGAAVRGIEVRKVSEDVNESMGALTKRLHPDVKLIQAVADRLPLPDQSVKEVHARHTLHLINARPGLGDVTKVISEMKRVAKERIVISQPHYGFSPNTPEEIGLRNLAELKAKLKEALKDEFTLRFYTKNPGEKMKQTYKLDKTTKTTKGAFILIAERRK